MDELACVAKVDGDLCDQKLISFNPVVARVEAQRAIERGDISGDTLWLQQGSSQKGAEFFGVLVDGDAHGDDGFSIQDSPLTIRVKENLDAIVIDAPVATARVIDAGDLCGVDQACSDVGFLELRTSGIGAGWISEPIDKLKHFRGCLDSDLK